MKTDKERAKIIGIVGTAVIHVLALILLLFVIIDKPEPQSEGGVEVMPEVETEMTLCLWK